MIARKFFNASRTPGRYDPNIVEGFGPAGKNTPRDITSLMPSVAGDGDVLGEIFWPNVATGTRVTTKMLVEQRDRFLKGSAGTGINHLPLLPSIDDNIVKAVYDGYLMDEIGRAHV
jgi:hypothetical protein